MQNNLVLLWLNVNYYFALQKINFALQKYDGLWQYCWNFAP